jgi:hypothetical protein
MVLAAHRALSLQLFQVVISFDPIGFDGDGESLETSEHCLPGFRRPIIHNTSSNERLDDLLGKGSYTLPSLWITFPTAA